MKTGGFDLVNESPAGLLDKFIFLAYLRGHIPKTKTGSYTLPFSGVPTSWSAFARFDYHMDFDVPSTSAVIDNLIRILFPAKIKIRLFEEVDYYLHLPFVVTASFKFDESRRQLFIDMTAPTVECKISDMTLPLNVRQKLQEVMQEIMLGCLTQNMTPFPLGPVLYHTQLLHTKPPLPFVFQTLKAFENTVATAFNLTASQGGNSAAVASFTGDKDYAAGLSAAAINSIYHFWWDNTTHSKGVFNKEKSILFDIRLVDAIFDLVISIIAAILMCPIHIVAALFSLAFDFEELRSFNTYTVTFSQPDVELLNEGKIQVSGNAVITFAMRLILQFRWFGIKHEKELANLSIRNEKWAYRAEGPLFINQDNGLGADLVDWTIVPGDLSWMLDLPPALVEPVTGLIVNEIENAMPPLVLSPALISEKTPDPELSLEIRSRELEGNAEEAVLRSDLRIKGLETYGDPPYTANKNRSCLEVHKSDCVWAGRIAGKNKVPYFFLEEAHEDGFDNCYYCLGGSKR